MAIIYDSAKREITILRRGLDFADAAAVFGGHHATLVDERKDYGELRYITAGFLEGRMIVMVWTPRGDDRRIISMRYAHGKEENRWRKVLG